MNLLVVGASGLLGSNVVSAGRQRGWHVGGTYHSTAPNFDISLTQSDLREHATFDAVLNEHDPDIVVNCAAMTDVDACEERPEPARVLNGEAPGSLAAQCEANGVDFVHVSTDYVFDGQTQERYEESAETNPVQVYGASKLEGERAVRDESESALVVRPSFVWGLHRGHGALTGFPAWVRDRIRAGRETPLFTDQRVTPTRAGQAADVFLDLVEQEATGCYHVACRSCVTPYEFGRVIAKSLDVGTDLLRTGSMDDVERVATRPVSTCLNTERIESALGRSQPTLREDVDVVRHVL